MVQFGCDFGGKRMKPEPDYVSGSMAMTVRVAVSIEKDEFDIWHAHSEDVFGLELGGRDRQKVVDAIPEAIKFLYRENYNVEVSVKRLCDIHEFPTRRVEIDNEFLLEADLAA